MITEMEATSSRSAELCAETTAGVWFCIRTHNKREHVAAAHLRKLPGVDVFHPELRLTRRARPGVFSGTEPLFPGYLFARFDRDQLLEKVNCTPAVKSVLRFGGRLSEIPDAVIEDLRHQMEDAGSRVLTDAPEEGEEVEIASGALVGTKGLVTHVLPAKQRVRILLELMGRSVTTELSLSAVLFNRRTGAQLALRQVAPAPAKLPTIPRAPAPRWAWGSV